MYETIMAPVKNKSENQKIFLLPSPDKNVSISVLKGICWFKNINVTFVNQELPVNFGEVSLDYIDAVIY